MTGRTPARWKSACLRNARIRQTVPDVYSRAKRSWVMSRVKGKDTLPEVLTRKYLHAAGLRFRLHDKGLPGTPDIVLPKYRSAIFVHGCFWHHHSKCERALLPRQNRAFWRRKISGNVSRDASQVRDLKRMGWCVHVVWGCELRTKCAANKRLNRLIGKIRSKA